MSSPQLWSNLEETNRTEMLIYLGSSPLAQKYLTEALGWVITGVASNDYNGVTWSRLAETDAADPIIAEVLARFVARKVPFLWHVAADSQSADLERRLAAHQLKRLKQGVCMAADLLAISKATRNTPARVVPGLVIEQVTEAADLAAWMDVWQHFDDASRGPREQLYASLGLTGDAPLRHYLARVDGQPVGVSQLFLGRGAAGLYCVATLPEVRGRGIGTALTLAPLRDAKALGYKIGVLSPTHESLNLYKRLGFELHPSTSVDYSLKAS